jgi:L-arabinose transport system ATP-binding protein
MDQTPTNQRPAVGPILQFSSITKVFPGVRALDDVSLELLPGEVLALVGENGAGKSTLLRVMNGDYHPDGGALTFEGKPVTFATPRDSHEAGVRVIYQEPEILADLSVAENIYLGELPRRAGVVDWNDLYQQAQDALDRLGVGKVISPRAKAGSLSAAQRQMVEIARAIKSQVKVLALDEPTSSLSESDSAQLFDIVNQFRKDGVALVYVSHRLPEILHLADRIAVLRDGKLVAVRSCAETSEAELVSLMVGRELVRRFDHETYTQPQVVMQVEGLTTEKVRDVTFALHKGEVLGFAGLVGAGRTDLAKALFGADRIIRGKVVVKGKAVALRDPQRAIRAGIGFTPEDRKKEALVLTRSVRENIALVVLRSISRLRFVRRGAEQAMVQDLVDSLRVKTPSLDQEVSKLSGGNQQKVVLARWLARKPDVLILDEPTRGVDVGAKAEIYKLIHELARQGMGVLFISSELPEVLGVSDRVIVMQNGHITGEMPAKGATEEAVLRLAMADTLS